MTTPPPEGQPPAASALPECAVPGRPGLNGVWAHDADFEVDGDGDDRGLRVLARLVVRGVVSRVKNEWTGFLRFPEILPVYSDPPVKQNKK